MPERPSPATRRTALRRLAATLAGFVPLAAGAATQIAPTLIELVPGQVGAVVEFTNGGEAPLAIEAEVVRWSQLGDQDPQEPTDDLLVSPPAATIPPGARQTLRLIRRRAEPAGTEASYRLLVTELPNGRTGPRGILFEVVHSVPVFVVPPAAGPGHLLWRAERAPEGGWMLVAGNDGGRSLRLHAVAATAGRGQALRLQALWRVPYVLPARERRWRILGVPPGTSALQVSGATQFGAFEQSVPLER